MTSFNLGGHQYRNQTAVRKTATGILQGKPGAWEITSPDAQTFLLDLLQLHPTAGEKIGVGVDRIETIPKQGNRCFQIIRKDGTTDSFSYIKCLSSPTRKATVLTAFRDEISEQTMAFRAAAFAHCETLTCPLSLVPVSTETSHVDHVSPQFIELVTMFCREHGIRIADIDTTKVKSADNQLRARYLLVDTPTKLAWQEYHHRHATLRIVSATANLKRGKKRLASDVVDHEDEGEPKSKYKR